MRVLIIDDSPVARSMIADMLGMQGHEVVGQAENLEQALALYKAAKPDLVTLDLSMPNADGIEVFKALQTVDSGVRVLVVSGNVQDKLIEELTVQGAKGFLGKPFSMAELAAAAEKAVAK